MLSRLGLDYCNAKTLHRFWTSGLVDVVFVIVCQNHIIIIRISQVQDIVNLLVAFQNNKIAFFYTSKGEQGKLTMRHTWKVRLLMYISIVLKETNVNACNVQFLNEIGGLDQIDWITIIWNILISGVSFPFAKRRFRNVERFFLFTYLKRYFSY